MVLSMMPLIHSKRSSKSLHFARTTTEIFIATFASFVDVYGMPVCLCQCSMWSSAATAEQSQSCAMYAYMCLYATREQSLKLDCWLYGLSRPLRTELRVTVIPYEEEEMHLLNAELVHYVIRARGGAFHLQWRPVISYVGTYHLMCRIQPASDTVWHYINHTADNCAAL
jgi:hypothetical protein